MKHLTIPARAVTGTGNRTRAFLTEREAVALATSTGYQAPQALAWLLDDGTISLKTGAVLALVPRTFRRRACPTRGRIFQVYGYHYAGSDVTDLIAVSA